MSSTVNQLSLRSSSMPSFIDMTLLAFVCACCAIDVRTRRIPNALSGTAALMGVALNALHGGMPALLWSIGGIVLMIALLLAPFALGGIGGGDVKMMAAVGAFLGPRLAVIGLTAGMMLGGIVMALHLLRLGRLRISPQDHGAISLPYSVPLGLGTLAAVLVGRVLGSPTSF
jgi:prepilin peptidase CpaA